MCPVTRFFAVETILSFWWDLESFDKTVWPVTRFFSLWRLTWVFDGTWKTFHKKVCPVTRFVRCGDYLKFLRGLGKFRQKGVPSHRFLRCGDYLKFWGDLEKFSQKSVPSHTFLRCGDYLKFLRGLGKFRQKIVPSHRFIRSADYLMFLLVLGKFRQKKCDQLHVFSLWRLTWVFDGTWKNFHKKSVPSYTFCSLWRLS